MHNPFTYKRDDGELTNKFSLGKLQNEITSLISSPQDRPYSREYHLPVILGKTYVEGLAMHPPRISDSRLLLSREWLLTAVIRNQLQERRASHIALGGPTWSVKLIEKAIRAEDVFAARIFAHDLLIIKREELDAQTKA